MMLAAITLLPAIIGAVGNDIDRWQVPSLDPPPRRVPAATPDRPSTIWERWATTGRAPRVAVRDPRHRSILLVIAWPVLSMRLGESDDGNLPTSTTQRQAYDLDRRRASGPAPTARCSSSSQLPDARATTRSLADISAAIAEARRTSTAVLPPQTEPDTSDGRADRRCSRRPRPTARRPPTSSARCASAVLPDGHRHERCAGLRGRAHRRVHRHRRPDQQTGSPTSSARSCCCRSCC